MTDVPNSVTEALAAAEAQERASYAQRLEFLDELDARYPTRRRLASDYARQEAETAFHLHLLRAKLAFLSGYYRREGCIPVDLINDARRTAYQQLPDADEAVDK